jgi:hypothetical protein
MAGKNGLPPVVVRHTANYNQKTDTIESVKTIFITPLDLVECFIYLQNAGEEIKVAKTSNVQHPSAETEVNIIFDNNNGKWQLNLKNQTIIVTERY